MDRGQRIALATGGGLVLVGAGGLFWKWWSSQKELPPPQPFVPPYGWQEGFPKTPLPPGSYYASLTQGRWVEDIGGGWLMLDATGVRDPNLDPDKNAHVGMLASLILQNRGAAPMVFTTKILNISGDDYAGQWMVKPPDGGPQAIDFRGANIFTLRKG
jgi:hypothetical protein